jgi:hypothetical protein
VDHHWNIEQRFREAIEHEQSLLHAASE